MLRTADIDVMLEEPPGDPHAARRRKRKIVARAIAAASGRERRLTWFPIQVNAARSRKKINAAIVIRI